MNKNNEAILKNIIQNYVTAYNNFDVDGMIKNLLQNVTFKNVSNGSEDMVIHGKEAFEKQARSVLPIFQKREQKIDSWEFRDNKVTIDISYYAVLSVDLPNGMKSGDELKLTGQSEFIFKGDKIISITDKS